MPLFTDLAKFADRVLVDGGSLITYCPKSSPVCNPDRSSIIQSWREAMSIDKDTHLYSWQQHKSPKEVATYLREHNVGVKYTTHGDVWKASEETVQTGLLHLILDALEQPPTPEEDELARHADWLSRWHAEVTGVIAKHHAECKRIAKFCPVELPSRDMKCRDVHYFAMVYRQADGTHWDKLRDLRCCIARLKQVRSLADIEKLRGIGKRTADKIRAKIAVNPAATSP